MALDCEVLPNCIRYIRFVSPPEQVSVKMVEERLAFKHREMEESVTGSSPYYYRDLILVKLHAGQ